MSGELGVPVNEFRIRKDDEADVLAVLLDSMEDYDDDQPPVTVDEAFWCYGFEVDRDGNGEIYKITDVADRVDDEILLEIGAWVVRGSFVSWDSFGYAFSGKIAHAYEPFRHGGGAPAGEQLDEWDEEWPAV